MLPSRLEKIYRKWERSPHDVTVEELRAALESLGCSFRQGKRHPIFIHPKLYEQPGFLGGVSLLPWNMDRSSNPDI